jgi:UDP-N-acetylglucosamine 2-epimerase
MKIITIIGARPQFIKAAPVSKALGDAGLTEFLLHTGQHYDRMMSEVFFSEMGIPEPDVNIDVGSGSHGSQTGQMLIRIEEVLIKESPDMVLVYGDTNSTLAGALAASKLHIPLAHVESGLRSFNKTMPEEINRIVADHCADIRFCPTRTAVVNLQNEGIEKGVHRVGDTMVDALMSFIDIAGNKSTILQTFDLLSKPYYLATVHRPYNTDDPQHLGQIISALQKLDHKVVFPVHPRTRQKLDGIFASSDIPSDGNLVLMDPVGYLDMLVLEKNARKILTDSGGIQKEAFILGIPCITLRPETEWVETVDAGWNTVVGTDTDLIVRAALQPKPTTTPEALFGIGDAADSIVDIIISYFSA